MTTQPGPLAAVEGAGPADQTTPQEQTAMTEPTPLPVGINLDDVLPAWEASYEPGNVSDYLIGYTNSEAAAKGAAVAWVQSQSDKDPATLEWVEAPGGRHFDEQYELIQIIDGTVVGIGVTVSRRRAQPEPRPLRRQLTESEHDAAWHAIEGTAAEDGADPGTVLAAVLRALNIDPPAAA